LKYVRVRFQNFEIFMKKLKFLENRFFLPFFIGKHPHKLVRTILEYSLGRILVTIRPKTDDLGLTYSILKILTFLILGNFGLFGKFSEKLTKICKIFQNFSNFFLKILPRFMG